MAPSLIPVKPGERIKPDRRDAHKLAFVAHAQMLTPVRSTSDEEAVRELCRCREDAREDLRGRHRLNKFLMRRGFVYRAGKNWTQRHCQWLRSLQFLDSATRTAFEDYLMVV